MPERLLTIDDLAGRLDCTPRNARYLAARAGVEPVERNPNRWTRTQGGEIHEATRRIRRP